MADSGDKNTDDIIHDIWRETGLYNKDCYYGNSEVNLTNCAYGCYKAHVTGLINLGGECDYTQPNAGLMWANTLLLIKCIWAFQLIQYFRTKSHRRHSVVI